MRLKDLSERDDFEILLQQAVRAEDDLIERQLIIIDFAKKFGISNTQASVEIKKLSKYSLDRD